MTRATFFWTLEELLAFIKQEGIKTFSVVQGSIGFNLTYNLEELV